MCSLAPCRDGLGGAAVFFLDHRRGVAAVAPAPANHRVGGATAPSQKRGRDDVDAASSSSALLVRMDKELVALQGLLKRAKLLPRAAAPAENHYEPAAAAPRRSSATEAPVASSSAANGTTTTSQPKSPIAKQLRPEEQLARAAAREEFRKMLLEMEKAALRDETIYPEELEELGIYQYARTRTRKQAWLEDHVWKRSS